MLQTLFFSLKTILLIVQNNIFPILLLCYAKHADPVATSTPRSAQPVVDIGARQNGDQDGKDSNEAKRQSTSSTLTQVSTTDISSHGDELENDDELIDAVALNKNLQKHAREREQSQKSIALSDVVLEEASVASGEGGRKGEVPPPVPTSPPPSLEMEGTIFKVC